MNSEDRGEKAMCCFCGRSLPFAAAIEMAIYSRDGESSQSLYAHRECLRRAVVTEIVLLSELEED